MSSKKNKVENWFKIFLKLETGLLLQALIHGRLKQQKSDIIQYIKKKHDITTTSKLCNVQMEQQTYSHQHTAFNGCFDIITTRPKHKMTQKIHNRYQTKFPYHRQLALLCHVLCQQVFSANFFYSRKMIHVLVIF